MKKIIRNFVILAFTFVFALITLTACQSSKIDSVEKPEVINISYSYRPINVPTIVALEKKVFEEEFAKEGIEIKWHELEGPATTEALAAKSIDFAFSLNYVSAIVAKAGGNDIQIISGYSKFPKAIGLVAGADSGVSSVADLKGKKVALQKGTMLHEMLIKSLEQENIAITDVEIVGMPSPDALNTVLQQHVEAAIIPDPLLTKAISSQKVKLLNTAEGLILGQAVIGARTEFLQKYPEIAAKVLEVHSGTVGWTIANEDEALNTASEAVQMDLKAVQALYPKFDFSLELSQDNILKLKESADFLKTYAFIKEDTDTESLINSLVNTDYLPQ